MTGRGLDESRPRAMRRKFWRLARLAGFALLLGTTVFLAWLWISTGDDARRFFKSTNRYCSYVAFENGSFLVHYDGGPDQGLLTQRQWQFLGVFYRASGGRGGWQYMDAGVHATHAAVMLAIAWSLVAWFAVLRPRIRRRRGRCVTCGYDLRGLTGNVCPECGASARAQVTHAVKTD